MKSFIRQSRSIIVFGVLLSALGCSQAEKRVDQKLASEPAVKNSDELGQKTRAKIASNTGFSQAQKDQLTALQLQTHSTITELNQQSLKIRQLLIREITNSPYKEKEVAVLKNKLTKNEDSKLTAYFQAIEKANHILGCQTEQEKRAEFMNDFVDIHAPQ